MWNGWIQAVWPSLYLQIREEALQPVSSRFTCFPCQGRWQGHHRSVQVIFPCPIYQLLWECVPVILGCEICVKNLLGSVSVTGGFYFDMQAFVQDGTVQCFEGHPHGSFWWREQEGLHSRLSRFFSGSTILQFCSRNAPKKGLGVFTILQIKRRWGCGMRFLTLFVFHYCMMSYSSLNDSTGDIIEMSPCTISSYGGPCRLKLLLPIFCAGNCIQRQHSWVLSNLVQKRGQNPKSALLYCCITLPRSHATVPVLPWVTPCEE